VFKGNSIGSKVTFEIVFLEYSNFLLIIETYSFISNVSKAISFSLLFAENTTFVFNFSLFRLLGITQFVKFVK